MSRNDIFSSFSQSYGFNPLNWSTTAASGQQNVGNYSMVSISDKCYHLANLLETNVSSISERTNRFVEVLNEIFNVGNFNLFLMMGQLSQQDQNSLRMLLSPTNGVIFSTIERFLMENNPKFDVRLSNFHPLTQQKLKSVEVSDYFRCIFDPNSAVIRSNAFEYFLFRFADNVFQRSSHDDAFLSMDGNGTDCLYILLVQEYLLHFLPIDRSLAPLLDDSLLNRTDSMDMSTTPKMKGLGLLKRELYENAIVTTRSNAVNAPSSAFLSKSWSFIQILSDVWLINAPSSRADCFLVVLLRILMKHVYRFAYKTSTASVSAGKLDEFKENIVERVLAPRMLKFLDFNYSKWPLDSSFRFLLELWLTFIQPWSYLNDSEETFMLDRRWETFVEKHFVFYSRFLKLTFLRFVRTDLNTSKNAACAYRVVKAFGQPNLVDILKNIDNRSRSFAVDSSSMFDREFFRIAVEFCAKMMSASDYCKLLLDDINDKKAKQSWFSRMFGSVGDDETATRASELTRTCQFLNYSIDNLNQIFKLPEIRSELDSTIESRSFGSNNLSMSSSSPDDDTRPDCDLDESGSMRLTPRGRFQIANKLCSFNLDNDSGVPEDLSPPRIYEISYFVTFWIFISSLINQRFGKTINRLYHHPGVVGRFWSAIFYPPTSESFRRSPVSIHCRIFLPARLSFRYFASIRFIIAYNLLILLIWAIFSITPFVSLICSATVLILFVCLIAIL